MYVDFIFSKVFWFEIKFDYNIRQKHKRGYKPYGIVNQTNNGENSSSRRWAIFDS